MKYKGQVSIEFVMMLAMSFAMLFTFAIVIMSISTQKNRLLQWNLIQQGINYKWTPGENKIKTPKIKNRTQYPVICALTEATEIEAIRQK